MYFYGVGNGVISGLRIGGQSGVLYKMQNWKISEVELPEFLTSATFSSMWLNDQGDGWMIKYEMSTHPIPSLYRFENETFTVVDFPSGCENTSVEAFSFYDDANGVALTDTNKYWLLQDGQWSCQPMPFQTDIEKMPDPQTPFVNIIQPGHYLIGSRQFGDPILAEYNNGKVKYIDLPTDYIVKQLVYAMYF